MHEVISTPRFERAFRRLISRNPALANPASETHAKKFHCRNGDTSGDSREGLRL